jgi:hypothetical protein
MAEELSPTGQTALCNLHRELPNCLPLVAPRLCILLAQNLTDQGPQALDLSGTGRRLVKVLKDLDPGLLLMGQEVPSSSFASSFASSGSSGAQVLLRALTQLEVVLEGTTDPGVVWPCADLMSVFTVTAAAAAGTAQQLQTQLMWQQQTVAEVLQGAAQQLAAGQGGEEAGHPGYVTRVCGVRYDVQAYLHDAMGRLFCSQAQQDLVQQALWRVFPPTTLLFSSATPAEAAPQGSRYVEPPLAVTTLAAGTSNLPLSAGAQLHSAGPSHVPSAGAQQLQGATGVPLLVGAAELEAKLEAGLVSFPPALVTTPAITAAAAAGTTDATVAEAPAAHHQAPGASEEPAHHAPVGEVAPEEPNNENGAGAVAAWDNNCRHMEDAATPPAVEGGGSGSCGSVAQAAGGVGDAQVGVG